MTALSLSARHAVVFVDETGHDRFHDPGHRVFGWAGCAMTVTTYATVAAAWRTMKREHFPGLTVLHAAKLPKPTEEQLAALNSSFRDLPFSRFAAVTRSDAVMEVGVLNAVAAGTARRIETVLRFMPFDRVALVFEAGETWNAKVERLFGSLRIVEDGREIPVEKYFLPKRAAEPGLEIADFIAQAAGAAARTKNLKRKDLRAIFDGPKERSSFMLFESARRRT